MRNAIEAHKVQCQEVDDLLSHLDGLSAVGVSLRPRHCEGTLSSLFLRDISIQVLRSPPMLILAHSAVGRTTLFKVIDGAGHARWNGDPLAASGIGVCGPSRRHEAVYRDEFTCLMLTFSDAANDRIAARLGGADSRSCIPGYGMAGRAALHTLGDVSRDVEAALDSLSDVPLNDRAAYGLRERILGAAETILAPPEPSARQSTHGTRRPQELVHAVDDYLREKPTRPVYTEELCTALGVSATRLHQAFHMTLDMSPHRYLKLRRMSMVRATLLSRSGPWHSVKAAALSHGFWHLGQFAHDYRELYGERPSETLGRTQGFIEDAAEDDTE
jgi:AraC-like DNA-binding protein